jgi:hypothetical protein
MSLKTQLWIAVAALMLLSLLVSVGVSTVSAHNYLSKQLHLKNVDNAASLALSLTQLPKDEATVELALAAQFDTGHYRLIRLVNPRGELMQERSNFVDPEGVPQWFVRMMAFDIEPGVAHISQGWSQFGVLTVESQTSYAYESLWDGTLKLAMIFAGGVVLIGLLGTLFLNRTVRAAGRSGEAGRGHWRAPLHHHSRTPHAGVPARRRRDERSVRAHQDGVAAGGGKAGEIPARGPHRQRHRADESRAVHANAGYHATE